MLCLTHRTVHNIANYKKQIASIVLKVYIFPGNSNHTLIYFIRRKAFLCAICEILTIYKELNGPMRITGQYIYNCSLYTFRVYCTDGVHLSCSIRHHLGYMAGACYSLLCFYGHSGLDLRNIMKFIASLVAWTHRHWKRWPPYRRKHFQMHFLEWKILYFESN